LPESQRHRWPRRERLRLSQVVVIFEDGTDIYFARQLVNERIGRVEIPPGIERPQMGPVATGLGEVLHYILRPRGMNLTDLRTYHDWVIRPAMRPVPGTAEINSWGGLEKQYQVRLDPVNLIKYDLSFDQVVKAIKANNLNVGGGNITRNDAALLVHGMGRATNIPQIENIVLAAKNGVPIHLRDVAEVKIGHEIRRGAVTADGQGEAVLGLGFMLMGESSYDVTRRLRDRLDEVKADLPPGAELDAVYDRTELVDLVINTVRNNLFEGGLLVVAILFIFLGNLRAGLIVAAAIPLSMLFAFNLMLQFGIAGTLLSLGAIDFGIVVDSSVVIMESVMRHLSHQPNVSGRQRKTIVREGVMEVLSPAVFGQLIIMIVYLPILTLEGVEGKMFRPMALTVMFVLVGSFLVSLTLTPVLASWLLPRVVEEKEVLLVRLAKAVYVRVLAACLKFRVLIIGGAAAALALAGIVALQLGSEFVPRLNEGAIVIGLLRMPGTSLDESMRLNTEMERLLLKSFPDEVQNVWSRAGAPEVATDAGSLEETDMFVTLKPRNQWTKASHQEDLVKKMENLLDDIPGQLVYYTQPIEQRINEMISGARADIAIKLFGDDIGILTSKGREIEALLNKLDGTADLTTKHMTGLPILRVKIKQEEIARHGVSVETVLDLVASLGSKMLGNIMEGQLRFPLVIRLPEHLRQSPETVAAIPIATLKGERIPLSRLADVQVIEGPKVIFREWGKRHLTLQCNVRERDIGSYVAEAQKEIDKYVSLPPGYRIDWGGQFENMLRAQARLAIAVPLALALILAMLYFSYRNMLDVIFVFVSVPCGWVGGFLSLWGRDMPISVSAMVGFITLSGVSVLNSMVFVAMLHSAWKKGLTGNEAVAGGAVNALRTALMTGLVAAVGFIPMATSSGMGAEVQRPLATVVIGGIITSSIFTSMVLPVLYSYRKPPKRRLKDSKDDKASKAPALPH